MKNSTENVGEVLVTPRKMETFLAAFANATPSFAKVRWLIAHCSDFFPPEYPGAGGLARFMSEQGDEYGKIELKKDPQGYSLVAVITMARRLRRAWDEPDQRVREWYLFELRKDFHMETAPGKDGPPALTAFERAMFYLQRNSGRARHCINPDCPSPYFFAKSNKPQKYCSSICAGPAKREAKRKWWSEHGNSRRTK